MQYTYGSGRYLRNIDVEVDLDLLGAYRAPVAHARDDEVQLGARLRYMNGFALVCRLSNWVLVTL